MKLSSREKKLLVFLGVLAVAAALVWLVIIPVIDNASKLNVQKADIRITEIDTKAKTMNDDELDQKIDETKSNTQERLDKYLPINKPDIIMAFLENKSRQAGIKITGVRFLTPEVINTTQKAAEQPAAPNALMKLVSDIDSLNAGFMPQASAAPQPTPTPSSPAEARPEDMVGLVDMVINITGTYSDIEAFVRIINESGKYIPVKGLELARNDNGEVNGQITLRLYNVPMPESTGTVGPTNGSGSPRDPFNEN